MNDAQEKIPLDTNNCRTRRIGEFDLFNCRVEKQYLICGYALPFGYGRFCQHPQRQDFAERLLRDKPVKPSQVEPLE